MNCKFRPLTDLRSMAWSWGQCSSLESDLSNCQPRTVLEMVLLPQRKNVRFFFFFEGGGRTVVPADTLTWASEVLDLF